jgi:hypothetical protein
MGDLNPRGAIGSRLWCGVALWLGKWMPGQRPRTVVVRRGGGHGKQCDNMAPRGGAVVRHL